MAECMRYLLSPFAVGLTFSLSKYVDQSTALAKNLTYANGDHFIIRADSTSVLSSSGPGRSSVRIQSKRQYLNHVAVYATTYFLSM